jgi:hypothetical protein
MERGTHLVSEQISAIPSSSRSTMRVDVIDSAIPVGETRRGD